MQTDRFHKLRRSSLEEIFSKKTIVKIWRDIVRDQLRGSDLKDLYDHYDFNYNIEERAANIYNEIMEGKYRVSQPLVYRIEKKLGVCRHLVILQPTDALVFQVLVERISDKILANQPSKNAFYSRDRHNVSRPHMVDGYIYNWREQWKKLQKNIYKFSEEHELIVVTDISNYYDSIDIRELRKVFTSYLKANEVLVDLMFKLIEEMSWKPDYMPYSGRGLPTTNIEGIRLLAHSFLFEIDEILKMNTNNSFTRWMDDIVFGSDSRKKAIGTISSISDMLKSRGLSLNLSKTDIYDQQQGYYHFQIEANRYIDEMEKVTIDDDRYSCICEDIHNRFVKHFEDQGAKSWDKVAKRYITLFGKLKYKEFIHSIPAIYIKYPILRQSLLMYLASVGYGELSSSIILEITKGIDIFDDISLYQICLLVTQWQIPINPDSDLFLRQFETEITSFSFARRTPSDFYCILWFKAKYDHPTELSKFIIKYKNLWESDSFLRRQATASLARIIGLNMKAMELLNNQISSGVSNTVALANQILEFSKIQGLDQKLNYYLFPVKRPIVYPLAKFLVLCSVLNSECINEDPHVREKVNEYITDPYYKKWIELQYNIR